MSKRHHGESITSVAEFHRMGKRFKHSHGHSMRGDPNNEEPNAQATHRSAAEGALHQERLLLKQTNNTIYRVSSTVFNGADQGAIVGSASYQYGGINFKASSVPDFANYSACFDEYRIEGIKIKFIPQQNVSMVIDPGTLGSQLTSLLPLFATCIDVNDSATPGSVNTVLGKDTGKVHSTNSVITRKFVPFVSKAVYQSGFTGYGPEMNSWVDTVSTGVNHYGLKWWLQSVVNYNQVINVSITYYFAFRMSV